MKQSELDIILAKHKLWLDTNEAEGERANLSEANLREATLIGADLMNITGKDIITFQYNKHFAYYCDGIIKIGCLSLTPKEWLKQYKEIGVKERYTEKEIKAYGAFIRNIKVFNNEDYDAK